MDLIKLSSSTYLPVGEVIEGYSTFVWAERTLDFGEFEIKTSQVERFMDLLPEDTFISHLETRVMMIVETHTIDTVGEGSDALEELTIRGRCASRILDERWVESAYQKKRTMRRRYSALGAVEVLVWNAIDNGSGKDVTRGESDPAYDILDDIPGIDVPERNDFAWNTKDALPGVAVTETTADAGNSRAWQLEQGILYPQLRKILDSGDIFLRVLRPVAGDSARVIKVKTNLADRGDIERVQTNNLTQARFDIYNGVDRRTTVKFSDLQEHIQKGTYLYSSKDYHTALEVMSGGISFSDVYRPGTGSYSGWQRRVGGFDAGSPEIPPEPDKPAELKKGATKEQREKRQDEMDKWIERHARWRNKRNRILEDFREETAAMAQRELRASRRIEMFSGDISPMAPYKYKTHYDLGDLVTLVGKRGLTAVMRVSEYVRTEDANGDQGLPGLVTP